jgi:hypothetical protein
MPFHSVLLILTFKQPGWYLNVTARFMKKFYLAREKEGGGAKL